MNISPGKWVAAGDAIFTNEQGKQRKIVDLVGSAVHRVYDARLIAAAPELFAAARNLVRQVNEASASGAAFAKSLDDLSQAVLAAQLGEATDAGVASTSIAPGQILAMVALMPVGWFTRDQLRGSSDHAFYSLCAAGLVTSRSLGGVTYYSVIPSVRRAAANVPAKPAPETTPPIKKPDGWTFDYDAPVQKISGGQWRGFVCGFYTAIDNGEGYVVASAYEKGSKQIYPRAALCHWEQPK